MELLWILLMVCGFIQANSIEEGTIFLERGNPGIVSCPPVASGRIPLDQIDAMYWYFPQVRDKNILISYFLGNVAPQNGIPDGVYDINRNYSLVIENVTDSDEGTYYCRVKPRLKMMVDGHVMTIRVKVSAIEPFPDVSQCTQRISESKCEAVLPNDIKKPRLTCVVRNVKPAVALQWLLEYSDGDTQLISDRLTLQPSEYSINAFTTSASIPIIASNVDTLYRCQVYGEALGARNGSHVTVIVTKPRPDAPQITHFTTLQPTTTVMVATASNTSVVEDAPHNSPIVGLIMFITGVCLALPAAVVLSIHTYKVCRRKTGEQNEKTKNRGTERIQCKSEKVALFPTSTATEGERGERIVNAHAEKLAQSTQMPSSEDGCGMSLEMRPLHKSADYVFTMSTASASDIPQIVVRYAEQLAHQSTPMTSSEVGHPVVYFAPLKEESASKAQAFSSYSLGVRSGIPLPHKVIMVVGASGTGKSTLINAMINYILGVKWEDNFRFKLVDERGTGTQTQANSQTQNITSYTINSNDHTNVPYTLTIIDTPGFGDTSGWPIERDRVIVAKIFEFFSHPETHGVDHIDAVGFVVRSSQARLTVTQRYIFESIQSVFGKDINQNILLLVTFCDGQSPEVLEAVQEAKLPFAKTFKFNNSALFVGQGEGGMSRDAMFWHMGYKSMHEFVDALDGLQPESLNLTVKVREERKRLEIILKGLQPQIQIACEWVELLNNIKEMLEVHQMEIEGNKSFEYEVEVAKLEKIPRPGKGSTNCSNCLFTCHHPCTFSNITFWCHAMTWLGNCTVCPSKCSSSKHVHQYFTYRWITVKEKQTYADIENRYRDAQGRKQSREAVIKEVEADLANAKAAVDVLIKESHRCTLRLEEIALRPTPVGVIEYMDMLIETEKATKNKGWEKRVGSLEATKQRENSKKAMKVAAESDSAVSIMWNKLVKQFGL